MKLNSIQFPVFNPYNQATVELYFAGCNRGCEGCQNPQLSDFDNGTEIDFNDLVKYLGVRRDFYEIISFTGGDLLCQDKHVALELVFLLKNTFLDKQFWLFTGAERKDLPWWVYDYFDYIKVGHYDVNLKCDGFPSSTNQLLLKKGVDYKMEKI